MKLQTILLVDDEARMLDLLSLYLRPNGYNCIKSLSGLEALTILDKEKVDIVLLDVMMPKMDGWTACKKIRRFSEVPIIMLTARGETVDVVKGLKHGADDYVTKPFHQEELLARIDAVLRRTSDSQKKTFVFKGLEWNEDAVELTYKNQVIPVTPKELALVGLFLKNPNRVFSRDILLSVIWGTQADIDFRTIDSHIRNIREKLRNIGFPVDSYLSTIWGMGYKWITGK